MRHHGLIPLSIWLFAVGNAFAQPQEDGEVVDEPTMAEAQADPERAPGEDAYFQRLLDALAKDESYKVRLQAAVFLGRSNNPAAVDPLVNSLQKDAHFTVRAAAATALAGLGAPRAISHIIRRAAVDPEAFVREQAMRALRKYEREEAMPYVVTAFSDEDARVRKEVVEYLADGDLDSAEVVLVRALGDVPEIFDVAKRSLLDPELSDEDRLAFLSTAIEHRDPSVRRGAVEVLTAMGTPAATQIIFKVYEREIEVDQVRLATRTALRALRAHLPIKEIVEKARSNKDKHERASAIKLLGVVGGDESLQVLLEALQDKERYLRGTAVMALMDAGNVSAVPALEKLLEDPYNQRIALQIKTAIKRLKTGAQDAPGEEK